MPISLVDKVVELAENGADDLQLALVLGTPSNQTNAIDVVANQQDYDLDALWATPSASGAAIEIKRVFHAPIVKNLIPQSIISINTSKNALWQAKLPISSRKKRKFIKNISTTLKNKF